MASTFGEEIMRLRDIQILISVFVMCGCSSVYRGTIYSADGIPVVGAKIQAIDYPTLLDVSDGGFAPRIIERGSAVTEENGRFIINASAPSVDELRVRTDHGWGLIQNPSSRDSHNIILTE